MGGDPVTTAPDLVFRVGAWWGRTFAPKFQTLGLHISKMSQPIGMGLALVNRLSGTGYPLVVVTLPKNRHIAKKHRTSDLQTQIWQASNCVRDTDFLYVIGLLDLQLCGKY